MFQEYWLEAEAAAFEEIKAAVAQAVTLAHLQVLLMIIFGAQVSKEDFSSGASPTLWGHEILGFLSGEFKGAQKR